MEHERIPCRTPNLNAHIESFHRILENESKAAMNSKTMKKRIGLSANLSDFTIRTDDEMDEFG